MRISYKVLECLDIEREFNTKYKNAFILKDNFILKDVPRSKWKQEKQRKK